MTEQEAFRRIVNWLLAHTYLLQGNYAFEDNMKRTNPDYLFVERNFELFQNYLEYAGFRLERDSNYGVIFLSSSYEFNRIKLDKATTLMLYVLRLIYEEEREKLSLSRDIFTTTGDLVHKMISLGVIRRKPANLTLRDSLRTLNRFRIVEKVDGPWENADTRLLILPTILFIVTNERISNMYQLIDDEEEGEHEETEADAADPLHNYEKELIAFDMINFLTGKTAAGKSTIIDALQLVLLGDTSGSFFNKAANQKSARTLKSYLFGEMGDDGTQASGI